MIPVGVISLSYTQQKKKKFLIIWNDELTMNEDDMFVFVGVQCFSRPLNVFGMVEVVEGKEHLIPENFSTLRIERRNRDRSRLESVNWSWWELEVFTNELERFCWLLICNDDVRRTEDLIGVNDCSERLTIVERLLKEIIHK